MGLSGALFFWKISAPFEELCSTSVFEGLPEPFLRGLVHALVRSTMVEKRNER